MDLLLYFALAALATIVIFTGLAWLTRPQREAWKPDSLLVPPPEVRAVLEKQLDRVLGINEDTRPMTLSTEGMPAHEDSFSHDELWEAAAKMHRETPDEKATIDSWEREMHENAGKE